MEHVVVTVTKKGQATIPKKFREQHGIRERALVINSKEGVLVKPVPDPLLEKGSLKNLFRGRTSRQLIEEARSKERVKDTRFLRDTTK